MINNPLLSFYHNIKMSAVGKRKGRRSLMERIFWCLGLSFRNSCQLLTQGLSSGSADLLLLLMLLPFVILSSGQLPGVISVYLLLPASFIPILLLAVYLINPLIQNPPTAVGDHSLDCTEQQPWAIMPRLGSLFRFSLWFSLCPKPFIYFHLLINKWI